MATRNATIIACRTGARTAIHTIRFTHGPCPLPSRRSVASQADPSPSKSASSAPSSTQKYTYQKPEKQQDSWLAAYLKRSPAALNAFKSVTGALGMGNPRQVAGRVTFHYYDKECATKEAIDSAFWHQECRLPSTFQTWFIITNLHVWMLTVRFRALPEPHGRQFVQGLVDNFFLDVEDRLRQSLPKRAPERLVSRQMKILREQWAGLGMAFDYALGLSSPYAPKLRIGDPLDKVPEPNGDTEMAAAVWRNLLGARGARGIEDPGRVRRAFNVSGEYAMPKLDKENPEESLQKIEESDDNSGIYDFVGEETVRYLQYPQLMFTLVKYVRTELARLEQISDEQIIEGGGVGTFGRLSKDSEIA